MIWPEFLSSEGSVLSEADVPRNRQAMMYIVNLDNESYHRERILIGSKGSFVEGLNQ